MANPSSELARALGDEWDAPGRWYENYPNVIFVTPAATPNTEIVIDLEDSNVEQQHPTSPRFEKLQLNPYDARGIFMLRDPVPFLDEHQNPTMLRTLLSGTIEGGSWKEQWTNDDTVGHKMNLRLQLPGSSDDGVPERSASLFFYVFDHRSERKPITKTKLGWNAAKALKECKEFTAFCKWKGYKFDDLALYDLVNVSQGSWQPTLYVKVTD